MPSTNPLGFAASASARSLSGVRYSASSSASGLLALFFSASSLVLLTSACCSFRYLFCTSFSTFGFPSAIPFTPRWWLPWRWLQIFRLGCLLPFLAPFFLPLTSCAFLLFALFSRLLAIRSLLLLLVCALCSSSHSGVSSTFVSLAWFKWGRSTLSASLFLFASLLPGGILGFSFAFSHYPVFCCSCGLAGFCLFCPPLFAGHVRSTSASLSLLLGLPSMGLLL